MDVVLEQMKKSGRAAFRTREYTALRRKGAYARLVLHRLKKKEKLVLVRKGVWAFPDAMHEAIACTISRPCYLSFFSALHLHGLTTQIPGTIQLAVCRNAKRYKVLGTPVQEYRVKKGQFTGFRNIEGIIAANPEKAFADCLNIPRACPYTVLIEAASEVDLNKVKSFASKRGLNRLERLLKNAKQE